MSLDARIENVLGDYVRDLEAEFRSQFGEEGFELYASHLLDSLYRIRRRLGDQRYRQAREIMEQALTLQQQAGELGRHRDWIRLLLEDYYDGMYDYQLAQNPARPEFAGGFAEVLDYLRHNS